jgi:RNA polymerase sigma-70 factor (ECF subfamily)
MNEWEASITQTNKDPQPKDLPPDLPADPSSDSRACFQRILERYQDLVYRVALTHTERVHDAQDVYQDVFVNYWRRQPVFNSEDHGQAWFITVTRNCARNLASSSWSRKVVFLDDSQKSQMVDESFQFETDEQSDVFRALQSLPAKYRTVLHLFYFEDMSVSQISDTLEIRAGTIKVQLARGRDMMRQQLKGEYFYE